MPRTTSPPQLPESGSVDINRDYGTAFKSNRLLIKLIKKGLYLFKRVMVLFCRE